MTRPVPIVGVGAVTGYGWGFDALAKGLRSGESSARRQTVDRLDVVASVIPDDDGVADALGVEGLVGRYEHAALHAVDDALADARDRGWRPGGCVGVVFCTGIGDIRTIRDEYFRDTRPRPSVFSHMLHTAPGSLLARHHGWTGPNLVLNAACSSGNAALQLAQAWLVSGVATDVIVAGAEMCLIAEIITGFRRMRVLLAEDAPLSDCRPFQEGSRRFFLGEAAVAMVLTTADTADTADTTHTTHTTGSAPIGAGDRNGTSTNGAVDTASSRLATDADTTHTTGSAPTGGADLGGMSTSGAVDTIGAQGRTTTGGSRPANDADTDYPATYASGATRPTTGNPDDINLPGTYAARAARPTTGIPDGQGTRGDAPGQPALRPRAMFLGGATTHDAFHMVAPEPEGTQLERCYRDALAAAGATPADVGLVKAHGSGTPLNDTVEAALLDRLFPPATRVCSYKPLVGHAMALAALAELAGLLAGHEIGALPPHVTDDPAHPRLADGGPPPDGLVLCGSVGLGGANTAAVLDIAKGEAP